MRPLDLRVCFVIAICSEKLTYTYTCTPGCVLFPLTVQCHASVCLDSGADADQICSVSHACMHCKPLHHGRAACKFACSASISCSLGRLAQLAVAHRLAHYEFFVLDHSLDGLGLFVTVRGVVPSVDLVSRNAPRSSYKLTISAWQFRMA